MQVAETAELSGNDAATSHRSSPIVAADGQSVGNQGAPPDPVEAALATALERASADRNWATVKALVAELEARRAARAGTIDLAAERARRGSRSE